MPYKDKRREAEVKRLWRLRNSDKAREAVSRWRQRNPDHRQRWREKNPDYDRQREAATRRRIAEYKLEHGCMDCGYREHPAALEFDHVGDDKLTEVSKLKRSGWSMILTEIAKCEVVCANCHRVRTVKRGQHRTPRVDSPDGPMPPTLFDLLE